MTVTDNGIGRSPKGTVLHIIVPDGDKFRPLCDKRQTGYVWEHDLTKKKAKHIACKKCTEYKLYKDLFRKAEPKDVPAKKVEAPKPKPEPAKTQESQERKDIGVPSASHNNKFLKKKKEKQKVAEKPIKKKEVKPEELDDFYEQKTSNGKYQILHRPTGQRLFDGIDEDKVIDCLIALNEIEIKWKNKNDPVPDGFITSCKDVINNVCGSSQQPKKKTKVKKEKRSLKRRTKPKTEKPHRPLKRRKKKKATKPPSKKKRSLKRRNKKPKEDLYGFQPNSPGGFIVRNLKDGVILRDIISAVSSEFKMLPKKANGKFKGVIRKLSRRKGVIILHIMRDKPERDVFKIKG